MHINLRGYPGRTAIPKCRNDEQAGGKRVKTYIPCFADAKKPRTVAGYKVTLYTVNRDADQWHLLYAWRRNGSLYTVSDRRPAVRISACAAEPQPDDAEPRADPAPVVSPVTRRELLAGAAAAAVAGGALYELVDRLGRTPSRASAAGFPKEQHVLDGLRVVSDDGIEVVVAPLHHRIVTAKLRVAGDKASLVSAREDSRCARLDRGRPEPTPAGLGVTAAWGLPYFDRFVPEQAAAHIPTDLRATRAKGHTIKALTHSIRFPSDPTGRDPRGQRRRRSPPQRREERCRGAAEHAARDRVLEATSIRMGFVGGGFEGGSGCRRGWRSRPGSTARTWSAHVRALPGPDLHTEGGLGPPRIANFETLGYTDAQGGYFEGGTHMAALPHLRRPRGLVPRTSTSATGSARRSARAEREARERRRSPSTPRSPSEVARGFRDGADRPQRVDPDRLTARPTPSPPTARVYRRGTAIRSAPTSTRSTTRSSGARGRRRRDGADPAAGVHFVIFNPRATTSTATGLRWTACSRTGRGCRCRRAAAARGSTPSSRRRTGRTSSCRRAPPLLPAHRTAAMSGFTFRELTRDDADQTAAWRYPAPYSLYDGGDAERLPSTRTRRPGRGRRARRLLLLRRARACPGWTSRRECSTSAPGCGQT